MRSLIQKLAKLLETDLAEGVSKDLGNGKWEYQGKKGVWRTAENGDKMFFPDGGGEPLGMNKHTKAAGGGGAAVKAAVDRAVARAKRSAPGGGASETDELDGLSRDFHPDNREVDRKYGGPTSKMSDADADAVYAELSKMLSRRRSEDDADAKKKKKDQDADAKKKKKDQDDADSASGKGWERKKLSDMTKQQLAAAREDANDSGMADSVIKKYDAEIAKRK